MNRNELIQTNLTEPDRREFADDLVAVVDAMEAGESIQTLAAGRLVMKGGPDTASHTPVTHFLMTLFAQRSPAILFVTNCRLFFSVHDAQLGMIAVPLNHWDVDSINLVERGLFVKRFALHIRSRRGSECLFYITGGADFASRMHESVLGAAAPYRSGRTDGKNQ